MGDDDEVVIALPAHVVHALARGEAMAVDLDELGVRIVLTCTDEAVAAFRSAVMNALMHNLRPADGVH